MDSIIKKSPLISIIIPCYNDARYITQAVDSARKQNFVNKEIIVVDDGCNVETKEVLKFLEPKIDLLLIQENKGTSAARNVGIDKAKGDYIVVLDSDDFFDAKFCEKAVEVFDGNNDIKLITCYTQRFNDIGPVDIIRPDQATVVDFLKYNCAMGSSSFRKKDWEKCGGYDEAMKIGFEDWEFYIRLLKNGGRSFVIPEVLLHYRLSQQSRTKNANKIKYEIFRSIITKHKELYIYYFDDFICHLLSRLEIIENSEKKIANKLEFKIGKALMFPLRFMKQLLRKYGR
jgi:glycosyltransferase involved in cell wall biosynthesis